MSTIRDTARNFWDRISPRERRLVVIGIIVAPITLALWLGLAIHDGLDAMEARNNKTRKALAIVADMHARGAHTSTDDIVATMGFEPLSFDTYLTNAAKKAKFELKGAITPRNPGPPKGGFVTTSASVTIDKLTLQELKDFLFAVETDSKVYAVTKLEVHRDFRDKDKVTSTVEVSNYSKEPKTAADAGSGSSGSSGSATKKGN
jgi:hypothetical protein